MSVLRWPDAQAVDGAVRTWAREVAGAHPEVVRIGYIGSYARGDWGVGSDVDLLIIVAHSETGVVHRASAFDTTSLPVPADVIVYTVAEWNAMDPRGRFRQSVEREAVWVHPSPGDGGAGS